jgi:hypothetical protein
MGLVLGGRHAVDDARAAVKRSEGAAFVSSNLAIFEIRTAMRALIQATEALCDAVEGSERD